MKIIRKPGTEYILQAVKDNNGFCPCKIEQTKDTKCICKEFIEQPHTGECQCGLYIKTEVD